MESSGITPTTKGATLGKVAPAGLTARRLPDDKQANPAAQPLLSAGPAPREKAHAALADTGLYWLATISAGSTPHPGRYSRPGVTAQCFPTTGPATSSTSI